MFRKKEELVVHVKTEIGVRVSEFQWWLSPGDVLLDAVEAALGVISAHIGQVESKRLQFTGIF